MNIGIIGLGLIGGSIALDLKAIHGESVKIYGFDALKPHIQMALDLSIIDEQASIRAMVTKCELIVIAVPVDKSNSILQEILDSENLNSTVLDVGSIKAPICNAVQEHKNREQYVACHPIAGTEFSGPQSAINDLFKDKINIICDKELSSQKSLKAAEDLFKKLGSKNIYMSSVQHDEHITFVSHLSHISSFALSLTVLKKNAIEENIFPMAGSGFRSTVRLAKSSAEMWSPIIIENKDNMLKAIDSYIDELSSLREIISEGQKEKLTSKIKKSNQIEPYL